MNNEQFKANYTARNYHGDPIYSPCGNRITGYLEVEYYYVDERTIRKDGLPLVVWYKSSNGRTTTPGFLKGWDRQSVIKWIEKMGHPNTLMPSGGRWEVRP